MPNQPNVFREASVEKEFEFGANWQNLPKYRHNPGFGIIYLMRPAA